MPNLQSRDYSVSTSPQDWQFVERLLPATLKPAVPKLDRYPSGFLPQKNGPDESVEMYQYYVGRTFNHMLPVYLDSLCKDNSEHLFTTVKRAEGNLYQLRKDIDDFLFAMYKREFICQVSELQNSLRYKGDLQEEIKIFLLNKGL